MHTICDNISNSYENYPNLMVYNKNSLITKSIRRWCSKIKINQDEISNAWKLPKKLELVQIWYLCCKDFVLQKIDCNIGALFTAK